MDLNLNKLSNKQLEFIYSRFVAPDKNTFNIKVVGAGFNEYITNKIIDFILNNCSAFSGTSTIAVLNDFSFHIIKALMSAGIPAKNIKLLFFKKDKTNLIDDSLNDFFKLHPVIRQNKDLQIITFKELQNMKIDGIIANPPYGAIGANITKKIIDTVDFKEYINLLPANDYKRNTSKDLFNYQSDMITLTSDSFTDATVIPHIAKIHKNKVNNLSYFEFLVSQFTDRDLDKYFIKNIRFPGGLYISHDSGNHPEKWEQNKTLLIGFRDCSAGHMPYSKDCNTYKWNVEHSIDKQYIINNCNYYAKSGRGFRVPYAAYNFNTEAEYINFISFFYSNNGFRFMSKVMTALNTLSAVDLDVWAPKVDWTRSWTVEEILSDYGYTEDEIKEVMDDLKKFKGMDD